MISSKVIITTAILLTSIVAIAGLHNVATAKEMTCDLNHVKSCTIIAKHGDIEIDRLVIVNKVGNGGGSVDLQPLKDAINQLKQAQNETNTNVENLNAAFQNATSGSINNIVVESENATTGNQTGNQTGGGAGNETGGVTNETGGNTNQTG